MYQPAPKPDTSSWVTFKAESRIARRVVVRQRATTILVAVLITLPIMILSTLMVLGASSAPNLEQQVALILGKNQSMVQIFGSPNSSRAQSLGNPYIVEENQEPPLASNELESQGEPTDLPSLIPAEITPFTFQVADGFINTENGFTEARLVVGPSWEPSNDGIFRVLSGVGPQNNTEAMISPAAAEKLGIGIGGKFTLLDGDTFTVTGIMKAANHSDDNVTLFFA